MLQKIVFAMLCLAIIFDGCHFGTEMQNSIQSDKISCVTENNALYMLSLSKTTFGLEDTLQINFEVQNLSMSLKTFRFHNVQQCGFELKNQDGIVVIYKPRIVQPAPSRFQLNSFEKKQFSLQSLLHDGCGNTIRSGDYSLETFLLIPSSPRVRLKVRVQ